MSYPAINEVTTRTEAVAFLKDVLHYIGAHYGGTLAAHLVSLALREVEYELSWEREVNIPTYQDYSTCHEFEIAPGHDVRDCDDSCPEHGHIWRAFSTH